MTFCSKAGSSWRGCPGHCTIHHGWILRVLCFMSAGEGEARRNRVVAKQARCLSYTFPLSPLRRDEERCVKWRKRGKSGQTLRATVFQESALCSESAAHTQTSSSPLMAPELRACFLCASVSSFVSGDNISTCMQLCASQQALASVRSFHRRALR